MLRLLTFGRSAMAEYKQPNKPAHPTPHRNDIQFPNGLFFAFTSEFRYCHNSVFRPNSPNPPSGGTSPESPRVAHSVSPCSVPCPERDSANVYQHRSALPNKSAHLKLHLREL